MQPHLKRILNAFNGKLVGTKRMQYFVCQTLALMTPEIIDVITATCWLLSSMDDAWAFTFTGNDLKDRHLIFLSDDLFNQPSSQIHYTIAHEIGHVMLGHKNSTLRKQTKAEVTTQEREADTFAKQFVA